MCKNHDYTILKKRCILSFKNVFTDLFHKIMSVVSFVPLIISVLLCGTILFSNFFTKIPDFSYFYKKKYFPISYNLTGTVELFNSEGTLIESEVEVFVGGYSISTLSSQEFSLTFSSPKTDKVYIVFIYNMDDEICEHIELLDINNDCYIEKEFKIYV